MSEPTQIKPRSQFLDARTQERAPSISLAPRNFEELWRFAEMICKTDFVPNAFKGNPGAVIACCQFGNEVGLKPMTALKWIAIVNGTASIWGDGALMLLRSHARFESHMELEPEEALKKGYGQCTIKAKGEPAKSRKFTIEQAKTANLWGGKGGNAEKKAVSSWALYPGRMLQMRARALAIRDTIPEALGGLSIGEEQQDVAPRDVTPDNPPTTEEAQPIRLSDVERVAEHERGLQPAADPPPTPPVKPAKSEDSEYHFEPEPDDVSDDESQRVIKEGKSGSDDPPPFELQTDEQSAYLSTEQQQLELTELLNKTTVGPAGFRRYIKMQYNVENLAKIPAEHFDEIRDWLVSNKTQKS